MSSELPIRAFWLIARAEGISLLLLLGVAMPLKYLAHLPAATAWTGWLHGQLFLVYFVALASAARMRSWSWLRIGGASLAALVPFGTFIFERRVQASI